jgi:hypothetical protein
MFTPSPRKANPDAYETWACKVTWFAPSGRERITKSGERREELIPMYQIAVHIRCNRTNTYFRWMGTPRNGEIRFKDKRFPNERSITGDALRHELTRMMGDTKATLTLMDAASREMTRADYLANVVGKGL